MGSASKPDVPRLGELWGKARDMLTGTSMPPAAAVSSSGRGGDLHSGQVDTSIMATAPGGGSGMSGRVASGADAGSVVQDGKEWARWLSGSDGQGQTAFPQQEDKVRTSAPVSLDDGKAASSAFDSGFVPNPGAAEGRSSASKDAAFDSGFVPYPGAAAGPSSASKDAVNNTAPAPITSKVVTANVSDPFANDAPLASLLLGDGKSDGRFSATGPGASSAAPVAAYRPVEAQGRPSMPYGAPHELQSRLSASFLSESAPPSTPQGGLAGMGAAPYLPRELQASPSTPSVPRSDFQMAQSFNSPLPRASTTVSSIPEHLPGLPERIGTPNNAFQDFTAFGTWNELIAGGVVDRSYIINEANRRKQEIDRKMDQQNALLETEYQEKRTSILAQAEHHTKLAEKQIDSHQKQHMQHVTRQAELQAYAILQRAEAEKGRLGQEACKLIASQLEKEKAKVQHDAMCRAEDVWRQSQRALLEQAQKVQAEIDRQAKEKAAEIERQARLAATRIYTSPLGLPQGSEPPVPASAGAMGLQGAAGFRQR
eukprot:gnl/TRDRNA2_/TRDRNA2_162581_c0_seq1.p1 gnl/TRDRNA2_/TRDRNA2_162581_c0~~gnl/TRDRNA2_/TRDRNA2_162581_c0_seq1.p1  ORF type:complete len:540 (-),score=77.15 gnl/TRDRNA2_/TRDRNA2_162581_c0_seq1:166-1785(-)